MITRTKTNFKVDYHTHILPFMDDGAPDVEASLKMLGMLAEQGIERVATTSHSDPKNETVSEFISRRDKSYELLCSNCDTGYLPEIVLSAEVYCTPGISSADLSPLCYKGTNYLLFELPRLPFGEWMVTELEVIAYKQKLVPVIAHLDRYMEWYSPKDIRKLLSFDDAVIQINNHAFSKKDVRHAVCDIIKNGYRVVIGSDAHDTEKRRPNFDMVEKQLSRIGYKTVSKLLCDSISTVVI